MTSEKTSNTLRLIPSTRFILALLVSFALFVQYAQRISLSMAIVCMVNRTSSSSQLLNNSLAKTQIKYGGDIFNDRRFTWTELQQQIVLGAHWFGYIFTLGPGGWLSMKFGTKKTFACGLLVSSIATCAMAILYFIDNIHYVVAALLRVIAGLGHGPLFPGTYTFWSMWAVPLERSTLTAIGFCSTNLGTSITMLLGGMLCRYITSGWLYIFLFTGFIGFIWLPLWLWLAADSPIVHSHISEEEKNYICDHIGLNMKEKQKTSAPPSVPWGKAFRSKPLIALLICQFLNVISLFFFYTNVGKILTELHHISPQYTGYILAGGFLLMPISSLSAGIIADRLVRAKKISLTNVRKLFNSITSFIPSLCMIVLCFCDQSRQVLGVIAVLIFLFSSGVAYGSGYVVNFGDIVPAYSSLIFSAAGIVGTSGALATNILAGVIVKRPILEDWRKLFIMFAVAHFTGGLVFLLYGSAVPRKWAKLKPQNQTISIVEETTELMGKAKSIEEENNVILKPKSNKF